jgi:hypothetical protein
MKHRRQKFGLLCSGQRNFCTDPRETTVKKLRTSRKTRINLQKKREKRALRSKAKAAHRRSTGFKEITETT